MTTLLDPNRACYCHLCVPGPADTWRDNTAALVTEHGWSVMGIATEDDVPPWAFTIGLWHTLGSPEVAMFGLRLPDMQTWVNRIGAQIGEGHPLVLGEHRHGVLDGFPLEFREVHESWFQPLFGSALNFYQRPPLPIVQAVWPDRTGLFPWEPGCGDNCRANQPTAWLPYDESEPSIWTDLYAIDFWPFPDDGARTRAVTLERIVAAGAPIRGVIHDQDGSWQFLDGEEATEDDLAVVPLHHLVARHPRIREVADLGKSEQAWLDAAGEWQRGPA